MHILLIQAELYLPHCHTLKEKRSVMKPLLHRIRNDFNVSAAEMERHDESQWAVMAFTAVGPERTALERLERNLEEMIEHFGDFSISAWEIEWL